MGGKREVGLVVTVAIGLAIIPHVAFADPSPDKPAAAQLVALVNQERLTAGITPLAISDVAVDVAERWSVHMATTGELAHNDEWFTAETKQRAGAKLSGENVAYNNDIADAHQRLMNSPGHRANILDARFDQIGVGAVQDGNGRWWITEDFLQLKVVSDTKESVPPPPAVTPAPATPPPPPVAPPVLPAPLPEATPTPTASPSRSGGTTALASTGGGTGHRHGSSTESLTPSLDERSAHAEMASGPHLALPAGLTDGREVALPLAAIAFAALVANAVAFERQRRRLVLVREGGKITRP